MLMRANNRTMNQTSVKNYYSSYDRLPVSAVITVQVLSEKRNCTYIPFYQICILFFRFKGKFQISKYSKIKILFTPIRIQKEITRKQKNIEQNYKFLLSVVIYLLFY